MSLRLLVLLCFLALHDQTVTPRLRIRHQIGGIGDPSMVAWPEGIKLMNNNAGITASGGDLTVSDADTASAVGWRTGASSAPPLSSEAGTKSIPARRTYTWTNNELLISCNMTALANPTCTRLMPPITWMSASGSRCKVLHDSFLGDSSSSIIEIAVTRTLAEGSLSALRMSGFKREDIYRMLDKGPWVLAFDISRTLPKLMSDLEIDLSMNKTEAVHIVSHCPFLIAQYARYRGRDVYSTVRALLDVGYDAASLAEDVMRFPSMLAAPPDRLRGWLALLEGYGIARGTGLFGKMLKRAPFMYYINPPHLLGEEDEEEAFFPSRGGGDDVSTTASAFVVYESLRVLQLLGGLNLPDLDKIVRTQPALLLCQVHEVSRRCSFLLNLFLEKQHQFRDEASSGAVGGGGGGGTASRATPSGPDPAGGNPSLSVVFEQRMERSIDIASAATRDEARRRSREQLGALLLSFPAILSIEFEYVNIPPSLFLSLASSITRPPRTLSPIPLTHPHTYYIRQMRSACNALRSAGLRRSDVVTLARRHPPLLSRPAEELKNLCLFLKVHVGVRKAELVPFFIKYPAILSADVADLLPKLEYLQQAMRGTPAMLKKFPAYFSFELDTHIRPRAEFLRAVGVDPLINGLPFLVNAQPMDLSYTAGMQADVFAQFKVAFGDMWRKKKLKEKAGGGQKAGQGTVVGSAAETPTNNTLPFSGEAQSWNDALIKGMEDDGGIIESIMDAFDDEEDF